MSSTSNTESSVSEGGHKRKKRKHRNISPEAEEALRAIVNGADEDGEKKHHHHKKEDAPTE